MTMALFIRINWLNVEMWMAFELTMASFRSVYNATSIKTLQTASKEML